MKTKFLILIQIVIILLSKNINPQQLPPNWSVVEIVGSEINDIHFLDDKTGFIALRIDDPNSNYVIKKTTNRGNNWSQVTYIDKIDNEKVDIYFINENLGFISANRGIYKYSNGVTEQKCWFGHVNLINNSS